MSSFNRRQFLAALGLGAGSLALPSLGRFSPARAANSAPRRLLVMFTHHGCVHPKWRMRPGGEPETVDFEADLTAMAADAFSDVLSPLHRHRDRLMVLDGLSMVSAYRDPALSDLHISGQLSALTGSLIDPTIGSPAASHASIDQVVANAISRPDRLKSLELSVGEPGTMPCYAAPLQALPVEADPGRVWDRVFGLSRGRGDLAAVYSAQSSVLDRVQARYEALSGRLSSDDQQKLDQHRALIRDLEVRIAGLRGVTCGDMQRPTLEEASYDARHRTMTDLVVAAFGCDITRVATMIYGDQPGDLCGVPGEDIHGAYAHAARSDRRSIDVMTRYGQNHAEHMAQIMDALAAVPDGSGTMLDHTVVVWVSELGNSEHSFETWPVVIGGGTAFTGWRPGRYLRWAPRTAPLGSDWQDMGIHELDWPNEFAGLPHQHLLVSVARAFGVQGQDGAPLTQFGTASTTAWDGSPIDLTGPLDRLG